MTLAPEVAVSDLLVLAGATLRGRRADCPRCKRLRSVWFDDGTGVYYCHGKEAGCDFQGGSRTLARELGLARKLSPDEARALRMRREQAEAAATVFLDGVRAEHQELRARYVALLTLRDQAGQELQVNPSDEVRWEVLAHVERELRPLRSGCWCSEMGLSRTARRGLRPTRRGAAKW